MPNIRFSLFISVLTISLSAVAEERLTFDQFFKLAQEQSLDLRTEAIKAIAAAAGARSLNIPPPMVGYMRMRDQSGSSANGFEVSQMVPFPTKISKERSARKLEARAQEESSRAMSSEVRAKAKALYFALWASHQRTEALKEKKRAIESHIRLARAGVRSDSFLRIHLLKAESDLDFIENDLLQAEQEVLNKQAMAASFLNIEAANFHPDLAEPTVTDIPQESFIVNPHQLEIANLTLETFKARESAARSSWFPDLYLRYKQIGQTELMPSISEVMIGVSLPFVFPWDVLANVEKASAERMKAELGVEIEKRKIDSEKTAIFTKTKALKKQIDNIYQKLLPRAEKRMRLVHNLAPRDMETLQDHRETMEAFPELKLKVLDLRERYEEAVAELLKYARSDSI